MDSPGDQYAAEKTQATAAAVTSFVAVGIAVIGSFCRLGFTENSLAEWANFVGLSWFLLNFATIARRLLRFVSLREPEPWWTSHAVLTLSALGVTALCGGESPSAARGARLALEAVGAAGLAFSVVSTCAHCRIRDVALLSIVAAAFTLYAAGASWGSGYLNPLFVEAISFGHAQIDTLYHVTFSNMLRTYGVPTTGLDGVPFMRYHCGSHWLFARYSNLLGVGVIDFYNLAYPIIVVPFGLFSLITFATTFGSYRTTGDAHGLSSPNGGDPTNRDVGNPFAQQGFRRRRRSQLTAFFWLIVLAGYLGFLPYSAGSQTVVSRNSIIISESYALAVSVSLLTIAASGPVLRKTFEAAGAAGVSRMSGVLLFAALCGVIGFLKISVMLILAALVVYWIARVRLYKSIAGVALLAAVMAATFWTYRLTSSPGYSERTGLILFGFLRTHFDLQWWPYFWLFYYAWFWIVAALRFREEGIRTVSDLVDAVRMRRIIDVELIAMAAIVGAAPGLLITSYSSTHYFSDYQHWLALGVVLAVFMRSAETDHPSKTVHTSAQEWRIASAPPSGRSITRQLGLSRIFAGCLLLSLTCELVLNTATLLSAAVKANLAARGHASGETGLGVALMRGRLSEAHAILRMSAHEVEKRLASEKHVLSVLRSLDRMPLAEKRKSLLFIPRSNVEFWDLLHGPYSPADDPFVATALSGVAMIDGLPNFKPQGFSVGYGYEHYPRPDRFRQKMPLDESLPAIRRRCATMGFSQLIVVDHGTDGIARSRILACP